MRKPLSAYPQWTGQLRFADYNPDFGHTRRQGRLILSYGSTFDPGLSLIVAHATGPMSSMIPPSEILEHWDGTRLNYLSLLDAEPPFALHDMINFQGLPSMKIQITTFTDAGTAVAIAFSHPLGDAQTLLHFAHDWASTHLALLSSREPPLLKPIFDPTLLDAAADGDIDKPSADASIFHKASTLSIHRYDYWASATASCPKWALPRTKIPAELSSISTPVNVAKGPVIPWGTWDWEAPASRTTFFFSAAETQSVYHKAAAKSGVRISHQDALLAHLWSALIRARGLREGEKCFLNVTFYARRRLEKPLPPSFVGSPILNAKIGTIVAASADEEDVANKAASIRTGISTSTGEKIAAYLHEVAFELGGQRRWNCSLGDYHTIVTSWVGIGFAMLSSKWGTGHCGLRR